VAGAGLGVRGEGVIGTLNAQCYRKRGRANYGTPLTLPSALMHPVEQIIYIIIH
jgi:hypothetical protein